MDEFDINNAKKQIETEAKKLATRADNFKELENFDMDRPGVLQTLAFVFLGFVQDLFLRQDKIDKRNLEITLNMNSTIEPPAKATGYTNITGNIGGIIPSGTTLVNKKTKYNFKTLTDGVINLDSNSGIISSVGENHFIITTDNDHNLSSGLKINLNFPNKTELNSEETIVAIGEKTLRIDKKINAENINQSVVVFLNRFFAQIESVENGSANNETDGSVLTLIESIPNVNDNTLVYIFGVTGGRDAQVVKNNTVDNAGYFDSKDISSVVKKISGVTRVFVLSPDNYLTQYNPNSIRFLENVAIIEKTNHGSESNSRVIVKGSLYPQFNGEFDILKIDENKFLYWMSNIPQNAPVASTVEIQAQLIPCGSVKIFFVKDNQIDILPSLSEINDAREAVYADAPINMSKQNIIVKAPILKQVNIKASFTSPNTEAMKLSINDALKNFFTSESVTLGSTVYKNDIISTMNNARTSEGLSPQGLQLILPLENITSSEEELIVLGEVEYV